MRSTPLREKTEFLRNPEIKLYPARTPCAGAGFQALMRKQPCVAERDERARKSSMLLVIAPLRPLLVVVTPG
jgi:hypothetical protein